MYQNNLNNILLQCLSDDEVVRSSAYSQLCHLENEANFAYQLFQLYLNSSDCIKQVALLTCINALSRNIYKSDLSEFKNNLPELLFKININRHNLAEAKHLSVLMRKLVRHEYPQKWPELVNLQIESFQNIIKALNMVEGDCNSIIFHLNAIKTSMFVSNYIIKEQVSKRLLRDRNEMYKITQALFPLISDIWYKFNNHLLDIIITVQNSYNNDLELINSVYQTSSLMDSLLLQLLYYGQKTPYLDSGIIALISAVLTKLAELFKSKLHCEFLYKNIRKLLKFITHLIEHEPLLFALVDIDSFLQSLVNYLTLINVGEYSEHTCIVNHGLALINALFGSFTFNQEPSNHNFISKIEDINPSVYGDSIKILKNQCCLRLQYHFRDDGITKYMSWLLNNFIMLTERDLEIWNDEMSESFASLDYLPHSMVSDSAASIITSICSFKQNIHYVIKFVSNELAKCTFDNHLQLDAILHLMSSSVKMIAKHFEHAKILNIMQQILLNETPLYLKLRSLNLLNNIVKNYIYPEDQGLLVLNILIHCLSYNGPMNQVVKIVTLSPVYNFYVKTNECYFWQIVDDNGISSSSRIIQLVMNLFIVVTYTRVQTKCMNIICKLVTELDIHNNEVSTNQFVNLLQDILNVYKKSSWELRESILHLSLSLINSFDPYKCFISNTSNVLIYKFLTEIIINTIDFTIGVDNKFIKHSEYQELFYSIWVSLLRILPCKLACIDTILVENIFFVFDSLISKSYDFVSQPSQFHDVVLEYLALTISIFDECTINSNETIQIIAQKIQISHLFNLIESLVSNGIHVNKLLSLVYLMPNCDLNRYIQYTQQIIIKLWNDLDIIDSFNTNLEDSLFESLLPCIISCHNYTCDIFDRFLANAITNADRPKERLLNLLNLIENEKSRSKLYGCLMASSITKIIANLYPGLVDHNHINAKLDENIRILIDMYKDSEDSGRTFILRHSTYSIGGRTSRSYIDEIKTPVSYRIHGLLDKLYINTIGRVLYAM